ncbi:MAG: GntR family transcriptional regulator [Armatimonadota bacterium]
MHDFIAVDPSLPLPLYWQIAEAFRQSIRRGDVLPGDPLPSLRVLARRLRVSVSSVAKAYDLLASEGLISTRKGKGSVVSAVELHSRSPDQAKIDEYLLDAIGISRAIGMPAEELLERMKTLLRQEPGTEKA